MPTLIIKEAYGSRYWLAELTDEEYAQLLKRWRTIRGLHCCVPVCFIIPQAREIGLDELIRLENAETLYCHIHEYDDSFLEGSDYIIPDDELFWMEYCSYTDEELYQAIEKEKQ